MIRLKKWSINGIIDKLIECDALLFGDFKLKSGEQSPIFIDVASICKSDALHYISCFFANFLEKSIPECNMLYGPAYKGITLSSAVSMAYRFKYEKYLPIFFNRKEEKMHGDGGKYFGSIPNKESNIVIIDDVITNGKTKLEAIAELNKDFGIKPIAILVVVDRRKVITTFLDDIPVYSLINLEQISQYMKSNKYRFTENYSNKLEQYLELR